MDWEKLLRLAPGETMAASMSEMLGDGEPIVEFSETVLPREVLIARERDGVRIR